MNNQIEQEKLKHNLKLTNRNKLELTGVKKIDNFNSEEFLIHTNLGVLKIEGSNLEIQKLELDLGNLWIEGQIDNIIYQDVSKKEQKKQSFFSKLFK